MLSMRGERAASHSAVQASGPKKADQADRLSKKERWPTRQVCFPNRPSYGSRKRGTRVENQRFKHGQLNLDRGRLSLPDPLTDNTRVVVVRWCWILWCLFVASLLIISLGVATIHATATVMNRCVVVVTHICFAPTCGTVARVEAEQRMHSAASQERSPSVDHEQK